MTFLSQARPAAARRTLALPPLRLWLGLYRQRRALARLDARALRDIGLDARTARAEAARPFWDVPAHWQQD